MKRLDWYAMRLPGLSLLGLLLGCVLLLTACSTPTSRKEATTAARSSIPEVPDVWAAAQDTVGEVQVGWIAAFRDETLTKLVREAQGNNKDLQAAAANVERSWALARQAGAACWVMVLPDVISAIRAQVSGPLPRDASLVPLSVSSQRVTASPPLHQVRRIQQPP